MDQSWEINDPLYPNKADAWLTTIDAMIRRATMEPKPHDLHRYIGYADYIAAEFASRFLREEPDDDQ